MILGWPDPFIRAAAFIILCVGTVTAAVFLAGCLIYVTLLAAFRRRPTAATLATAAYAAVYLSAAFIAVSLIRPLSAWAEGIVLENGDIVVQAMKDFEATYGAPPKQLSELTPQFLNQVPSTGLLGYPEFQLQNCEGKASDCFGDKWMLTVNSAEGSGLDYGCDRYVFAPSGRYPDPTVDTGCHYGHVDNGWIFVFGD